MTHIDLFSGIGGFSWSGKQVWPDYRNLFFCDNNKFCQAVLRKNFGKDILIYDDIREVNIERVIADTAKQGLQKSEHRNNAEDRTENQAGVDGTSKGIRGGYKVKPGGSTGEYLISKSKHREERLKSLGNAIVPQVAIEIMRAIRDSDNER